MPDFDPRRFEEFQRRYTEFIGKSIIDGLVRPDVLPGIGDLIQDHGQGGDYRQTGGGSYVQGGGSYSQSGGGDYTQGAEDMLPR